MYTYIHIKLIVIYLNFLNREGGGTENSHASCLILVLHTHLFTKIINGFEFLNHILLINSGFVIERRYKTLYLTKDRLRQRTLKVSVLNCIY